MVNQTTINNVINVMGGGGGAGGGKGSSSPVAVTEKTAKKTKETAENIDKAGKNTKRFNFELLGTMFFGMAIERTFGGMVNKVLALTGVFEVFNALLISLLMPILMPIAKIFIGIFKIIMGLPKPVKALIGAGIVMAAVFGMLLFVLSQALLGLASILMILGVGGTGATIVGALGAIALAASVVLALFVGMSSWVLSLEDSLRRVLSILMLIGGMALTSTGIGSLIGVPMMGAGAVGLSPDIKIVQNNFGGVMSQAASNRNLSSLVDKFMGAARSLGLS